MLLSVDRLLPTLRENISAPSSRVNSESTAPYPCLVRWLYMFRKPPNTGDGFPPLRQPSQSKITSHCVLPKCNSVFKRSVILQLSVGRHDMLTVPPCDCTTTHDQHLCPLRGELHRRAKLFHVRHAVPYFDNSLFHTISRFIMQWRKLVWPTLRKYFRIRMKAMRKCSRIRALALPSRNASLRTGNSFLSSTSLWGLRCALHSRYLKQLSVKLPIFPAAQYI